MNNPQIYQSDQFGKIRVLYEDGKPLFCGRDVCKALGYTDPTNAMKLHCRGVAKRHLIDSKGRNQQANFLPEGDVYRLITHSKLPTAEQFERWVFDEVLPSIRRDGGYQSQDAKQRIEQLEATNTRMSAAIATVNDARKNLSIARKNHDYYVERRNETKNLLSEVRALHAKNCDNERKAAQAERDWQNYLDAQITHLQIVSAGPSGFDEILDAVISSVFRDEEADDM